MAYYYPFFAVIQGELIFAIIIISRLFISGNLSEKLSLNQNPVHRYLIFFIGSVFLSFFLVAWDRQYSWDHAVYHFIKVLILYLMVLLSINNEKDLKIFIWSLILIYMFLAYEPLYYFFMEIGGSQQAYGTNYIAEVGVLSGHVAAANNMNQMIPIVFYLFIGIQKKKLKILAGIPLLVFIICLIGTGSRGGVLGFFMFVACVTYFSKNRLKIGAIAAVLVVILFLTTNLSKTAERINPDSAHGRFEGLTHGIGMLTKGNILGVGPGCFLFARGKYFHYTMEAHNMYGQILGDLGIPGAITFFLFIRQIFINLIESKKRLQALSMQKSFLFSLTIALQVSLIVRLFVCMASHSLYFFYWYIVAPLSFLILAYVKKLEPELE